MLEIKNLHVAVGGKEILKGLTLSHRTPARCMPSWAPTARASPLCLMCWRAAPVMTSPKAASPITAKTWRALPPEERAAKGVFLAMQYPVEIPGVTTMIFLKTALNAQRRARGETDLDAIGVLKLVRAKAATLNVSEEMLKRALNVGFSGGEKKRLEILQMALFEPKLAILDETDSGLDIDALRLVAEGVNALRDPARAMLVITHYQRLLDYIVPDRIHVLAKGRIVAEGGKELALELEAKGYEQIVKEAA